MDINTPISKILISLSFIFVCLTACSANIEKLAEEKDIDALLEILANETKYTYQERADAASALGHLADKQAVKPLFDGLMDRDPEVRDAALSALEQINDPGYQLELDIIQQLNSPGDRELQYVFVNYLQLNDYNALGALANLSYASHHDSEIQNWAKATLMDMDFDLILNAASSDDEMISKNAWAAIRVLGPDPDMVPFLREALSSENEKFKLAVENYLEEEFPANLEYSGFCEGKTIPEASVYDPTEPGSHPIIICGFFRGEVEIPIEWQPFSITELQLIVDIREKAPILIETCDYYDRSGIFSFSNQRYQRQLEVKLYEAQTGDQIGSTTLTGSYPEVCEEFSYEGDIYGDYPEISELQDWLREQGLDW